jgi:hypothetical protein
MLSFMSGTQWGTYHVHPNQMNVLRPANVDDDDVADVTNYGQSLSTPTNMSYLICRAKISEAAREIVDLASMAGLEVDELDYDTVLAMDKKLTGLLRGLPFFFQLDPSSRQKAKLIIEKRPYIGWQRSMINLSVYTRMARLHRPYHLRSSGEPLYAYSRMTCLHSARAVIHIKRSMDSEGEGPAMFPESCRLWPVVHHVLMATMVLLMDLCLNFSDNDVEQKKEEILNCCKLLEKSQEESSLAKQGIEIIQDFLIRHNLKSPAEIGDCNISEPERFNGPLTRKITKDPLESHLTNLPTDPVETAPMGDMLLDDSRWDSEASGQFSLADQWTEFFDLAATFQPPEWQELFTDLDYKCV